MNEGTGALSDITNISLYDYETVCGSTPVGVSYPTEYEIPVARTLKTKDQGVYMCCVGEVLAQVAEAQFKEEMSEGYIYGNFRPETDKYIGMFVSKALDYWKKLGTAPKSYCDILDEMPELRAKLDNIPELKEMFENNKISGYVAMNYASKDKRDNAIKDALSSEDKAKNVGLIAVSKNYFGDSHCIWLIGWNDTNKAYKIKNSWGDSYGDKGIKEIPKDKIDEVYMVTFEEIKLPFADVKEADWFYDGVKHMYLAGLMNGTSDTTFEPNAPMTRAEVATLMWRMVESVDERFSILNKVINEKIK